MPLSFDTTNLVGIEAGLKKVTKAQPIINSTSAEPERLEKVPLLAKKYNARLIALTMGATGIPVAADERVNIAVEKLIPRMMEIDYPMENLIIDPLVLTVSGCQEYCPQLIEAVRTLQYAWDPAPAISVGLSNVSNAVPNENRASDQPGLLAMLMGVGLQMMIANPMDKKLKETIRIDRTARRSHRRGPPVLRSPTASPQVEDHRSKMWISATPNRSQSGRPSRSC